MKKRLSLIPALILCLAVSGCSSVPAGSESVQSDDSAAYQQFGATSSAVDVLQEDTLLSELTIEKTTVFDDDDTTISVTGIEDGVSSVDIAFYIENNSDQNLSYSIYAYAVNGIMSEDGPETMRTALPAHESTSTKLSISQDWMALNGLSEIAYIDLVFRANDDHTASKVLESDTVRIKTSQYTGTFAYEEGKEVYNKDGLSVRRRSVIDSEVTIAVTNNGNTYFEFDLEGVCINDLPYEIGTAFYNEPVLPGCTRFCQFHVDKAFRREHELVSLEAIALSFAVRPSGDSANAYQIPSLHFSAN